MLKANQTQIDQANAPIWTANTRSRVDFLRRLPWLTRVTLVAAMVLWAFHIDGSFTEPALGFFVVAGVFGVLQFAGAVIRFGLLRDLPLPDGLKEAMRRQFPAMTDTKFALAEKAFRQFFAVEWRRRSIGFMLLGVVKFNPSPSAVVDVFWREFSKADLAYAQWCELVAGVQIPYVGRSKHPLTKRQAEAMWADARRLERSHFEPLLSRIDAMFFLPESAPFAPSSREPLDVDGLIERVAFAIAIGVCLYIILGPFPTWPST